MAAATGVLVLVVGLVVAVRGLPLATLAMAGRRIEAAVQAGDVGTVLRVAGGVGQQGELRRVLERLSIAELLALGEGMAAAAGSERGARVLAGIVRVVEERLATVERWGAARERWALLGGGGAGR